MTSQKTAAKETIFKADSFFFFGNGKITCGESRGKVDVISLIECVDDVVYHLKSCHLSRVKVTEYELLLAGMGNFHPSHDEITKLTVCPKHRHNLGKYRRRSFLFRKRSMPFSRHLKKFFNSERIFLH